ncbi:DNA-binding transcriptional LysR family regulator [Paraburkholderia sp. WC7.3g]
MLHRPYGKLRIRPKSSRSRVFLEGQQRIALRRTTHGADGVQQATFEFVLGNHEAAAVLSQRPLRGFALSTPALASDIGLSAVNIFPCHVTIQRALLPRDPVTADIYPFNILPPSATISAPSVQGTWRFGDNEVAVAGRFRLKSADAVRDALLYGVGVGYGSPWLFGVALRSGAVRPLPADHTPSRVVSR